MASAPSTPLSSSFALHERLLARLRLRHLRLVDALATHANLRRAAESVHMSQPAATQMLRSGVPLDQIGLVLRHRSIDMSAYYAKVDVALLRGVAQPWPGAHP